MTEMPVIGFVPNPAAAEPVVAWARALSNEAEFVCCDTPTEETVRKLGVAVTNLANPDHAAAVAEHCRSQKADLLVAFGAADVIRASPCRTLGLLFGEQPPADGLRILVLVAGGAHDRALLELADQLPAKAITVATIEEDIGAEAEAVGQRELEALLRDLPQKGAERYETKVVVDNNLEHGVLQCFHGHDLVLVGATGESVLMRCRAAFGDAAAGVVKRAPPLRRRALPEWVPRINPSDYAELVQDLRQGSRWRADFVVMLAMASAIASLGLLQNSPAVVIGSMLLAPLMTPMIGFGLALVQANPRLARLCGQSIGLGFLLTLAVSFVVGFLVPGAETLSPEVLARGGPNILDLLIALFAAVAASFALARPGVAGAVAGVAIATALVPPVCAGGIALAYGDMLTALGALSLFVTNLIAIVFASTLTFNLMGVTAIRALPQFRRLARITVAILAGLLLVLALPLGAELSAQIDEGRPQPLGHPVTRAVARAIKARISQVEGVELMFMARSAVQSAVIVYVASDLDIDDKLADDLKEIVRREMDDDEIEVLVFAVRLAWKG